eukprot:358051-Chlamydomonas_euryale.AAC.2
MRLGCSWDALTPLCAVVSHPISAPSRQPGRENGALSRHVERGLPTTPPSPTSPSANNSCKTSGLRPQTSGILATLSSCVSLVPLRMYRS